MTTAEDHQHARTVVRKAVVGDIPAMVMIGKRFIDESGYRKLGINGNPHKLHDSLQKAVNDESCGVFVADRAGVLIGVAQAVKFTNYFSDAPTAIELFWWVAPEHRGGSSAIRLMEAMERWADEQLCVTFAMVDIVSINGSAPRIYERRGYELCERTWIKRLKQWQQ